MYPSSDTKHDVEVARGLGWASVAIGVAEILFPRAISRLIGIEDRPGLMRALGLRELVSALTILTEDKPSPQLAAGLWSRVEIGRASCRERGWVAAGGGLCK